MKILGNDSVTVNGHLLMFGNYHSNVVHIPSIGIEVDVDQLSTYNKVCLLDQCDNVISSFKKYDFLLWNYIVRNGALRDKTLSFISMPITDEVIYLLVEWVSTVTYVSSNDYLLSEIIDQLALIIKYNGSKLSVLQHFWNTFFDRFQYKLSCCYGMHSEPNTLLDEIPYSAPPYERCLQLFGEEELEYLDVASVINEGVLKYEVLPNRTVNLFKTYDIVTPYTEDVLIQAIASSLLNDSIDERVGRDVHHEVSIDDSCTVIQRYMSDRRIIKSLNVQKLKNNTPPLEGIL